MQHHSHIYMKFHVCRYSRYQIRVRRLQECCIHPSYEYFIDIITTKTCHADILHGLKLISFLVELIIKFFNYTSSLKKIWGIYDRWPIHHSFLLFLQYKKYFSFLFSHYWVKRRWYMSVVLIVIGSFLISMQSIK